MSYISKSPVFISTTLKDQVSSLANPAAGNHKLFFLNGALTSRNASGAEVTYGANSPATPTTSGTVTSYAPLVGSSTNVVSGANYTILDNDKFDKILVSTGASDRTITLPTAVDNGGRKITVVKTDSGTGAVILDGEGSETINGELTTKVGIQYGMLTVVCDGTGWILLEATPDGRVYMDTGSIAGTGHGSSATKIRNLVNITNTGTAFTASSSAVNGAQIVVLRDCWVSFSYADTNTFTTATMGVSVNANVNTNLSSLNPYSDVSGGRLSANATSQSNAFSAISGEVLLRKGDILRPHTNGGQNNTTNRVQLSVVELRRLT